jgi:acetate kinase
MILAINAGSSSVKFAVFRTDFERTLSGVLEGIGSRPQLRASVTGVECVEDWSDSVAGANHVPDLIRRLMAWIEAHVAADGVRAIGHRVAIGGLEHSGPVRITPDVMQRLANLVPLAPLHQPRNLEPIEILTASHPGVPQVACFDTAFHRTLPKKAQSYGLPRAVTQAGAHRYGFHGLSYEYIAGRLAGFDARAAAGRTIVCHLGSGASLCALMASQSVETTMGFSPLSGLLMATRPGDLDPGLILWLLRERGMSVAEVERMLYQESGLKGVSGLSGDMRALLATDDPWAAEAVELFVYRVATEIGRLTAALGGLDALVFTAGIGEHSAEIRARICASCQWLGLKLSDAANRSESSRISKEGSAVAVWVIPTDEERKVAEHTVLCANAHHTPYQGASS